MTSGSSAPLDMDRALAALLGDHSALDYRLSSVDTVTCVRKRPLHARLYYVTLADGLPTTKELVDFLRWEIVPFCIPRSERLALKGRLDTLSDTEQRKQVVLQEQKACKLFSLAAKALSRKGESAELLLYALLEWAYRAPQIVSKMYLKTSRNMAVHGADGIHLRFNAETKLVELIWGESKEYEDFADSLRAALASIKDFISDEDKYEREIDIARDHIDLGTYDNDTVEAVKSYINPYTRERLSRTDVFACLLVYDHAAYSSIRELDLTKREAALLEAMTSEIKARLPNVEAACNKNPYDELNFVFFLVPVESVSALRLEFERQVGLNVP